MAATTVDVLRKTKTYFSDPEGVKMDYPVAASTVIYKGSWVGLNAAGYLVSYVASRGGAANVVTGNKLVGIALDAIESQTTAGAVYCQVLVKGYVEVEISALAIHDVGKPVYIANNNDVVISVVNSATPASSNGCAFLGYVAAVKDTGVGVVGFDFFADPSNGKIMTFASPVLDGTVANTTGLIIPPNVNHSGLLIMWAATQVVVQAGTAIIVTLYTIDTAGTETTTGVAFTTTGTADAGSFLPLGTLGALTIASAANPLSLAADIGLTAKVTTQDGASGSVKVHAMVLAL